MVVCLGGDRGAGGGGMIGMHAGRTSWSDMPHSATMWRAMREACCRSLVTPVVVCARRHTRRSAPSNISAPQSDQQMCGCSSSDVKERLPSLHRPSMVLCDISHDKQAVLTCVHAHAPQSHHISETRTESGHTLSGPKMSSSAALPPIAVSIEA